MTLALLTLAILTTLMLGVALVDFDRDDAVKVGAAQVLALNPGTSRSGITMTAARYLGFTRDAAARASFLSCFQSGCSNRFFWSFSDPQRLCSFWPSRNSRGG